MYDRIVLDSMPLKNNMQGYLNRTLESIKKCLRKKIKCKHIMVDCHFFTISLEVRKLFCGAEKIPERNDFDIW